ncbi:hypothetical protein HDU80_009190 [Chytriomyces hyalinus]|nr:hypothetical protein HDU80_009190 [Chytriomyces hyalinus]
MEHISMVIGQYQQHCYETQSQLFQKTPLRFKTLLTDTDAIAESARGSSFFDLRRVNVKLLRKMVATVLGVEKEWFDPNAREGKDEDSDEASEVDSDDEELDLDVDEGDGGGRVEHFPVENADSDSDSIGDNDAALELVPVKDTNSLNRSLLGVYAKSNAAAASASPSTAKVSAHTREVKAKTSDEANADEPEQESSQKGESTLDAQDRIRKMRLSNGSSKRRKKNPNAAQPKKPVSGATSKATGLAALLSGAEGDKYAPPSTKLEDLGGIDSCIEDVLQLIGMPLKHPEVYAHLGIQPPRGILLHGPPGCGKSMLANAIAGESQVPFIQISAPSIVSGMSGESEKKIREIFEEAKTHAPCILFIDEIDAITPKRETAQREMERRIVAQLLTCMDDVSLDKTDGKPVLVIGATNRPDSLDPALRRAGRFDREIAMGVPDETSRMKILEKLCSKLRLEGTFDFKRLAKETPGYVGADLNALTSEAGLVAVRRIFKDISKFGGSGVSADGSAMEVDSIATSAAVTGFKPVPSPYSIITEFLSSRTTSLSPEDLESLAITHEDFLEALTKVQPSSKREGFATVPDVTWDDVGALANVRDELRMSVVEPIKHPELFARVGITKPMGVLLYGPPGCGKTMLAKAVASESCCNFISVKGPELLNKFVGESERGVRMVFSRAASSAPCVIFFDELDALCPARSNDSESQSSSRLVNTLLTEMDGMNTRAQVYIVAATNRPDMIDPAMLRPGRLDKTLYIDLPNADERFEILKTISRKTPISPQVCLKTVAADVRCDGFSGADLAALVREAAVAALRGSIYAKQVLKGREGDLQVFNQEQQDNNAAATLWVTMEHFGIAFSRMAASVSKKDRRKYELLKSSVSMFEAILTRWGRMKCIQTAAEANARVVAVFATLLLVSCIHFALTRALDTNSDTVPNELLWAISMPPLLGQGPPTLEALPAYPIHESIAHMGSPIPNQILRTWKTNSRREIKEMCHNGTDHPDRLRWFETWENLNTRAVQIIFTDADMDTFVKGHFSQRVIEAYFKLPKVVLRADYVRYMMLYELGGVYSDFDVSCRQPIWKWALGKPNVAVIVGVEDPGYASHPLYGEQIDSIQQWTMASARHHPFMAKVLHAVTEKIHSFSPEELIEADVLELTGPGIWKKVVWDHIVGLGANLSSSAFMYEEYQLYDDVLVLGKNYLNSKSEGDPNAFISHHSTGFSKFGWRNQGNDVPTKAPVEKPAKGPAEISKQPLVSEENTWNYNPLKMVLSTGMGNTSVLTGPGRLPRTIVTVANATRATDLSSKQQALWKSWALQNPRWKHILIDEKGMNQFVRWFCTSNQRDAYLKLPFLRQRVELFKFLWLVHKGGIYADPDTECKSRVRDWGALKPGVGIVLGFKAQHHSLPALQRSVLAAVPKHPMITAFVDERCSEILRTDKVDLKERFNFRDFFESSFNRHVWNTLVEAGLGSTEILADLDWRGYIEIGDVLIHGNDRFFPSNPNNPATFVWSHGDMWDSAWKEETLAVQM